MPRLAGEKSDATKWIVGLLALALVGGAAWYFTQNKTDTDAVTNTATTVTRNNTTENSASDNNAVDNNAVSNEASNGADTNAMSNAATANDASNSASANNAMSNNTTSNDASSNGATANNATSNSASATANNAVPTPYIASSGIPKAIDPLHKDNAGAMEKDGKTTTRTKVVETKNGVSTYSKTTTEKKAATATP